MCTIGRGLVVSDLNEGHLEVKCMALSQHFTEMAHRVKCLVDIKEGVAGRWEVEFTETTK